MSSAPESPATPTAVYDLLSRPLAPLAQNLPLYSRSILAAQKLGSKLAERGYPHPGQAFVAPPIAGPDAYHRLVIVPATQSAQLPGELDAYWLAQTSGSQAARDPRVQAFLFAWNLQALAAYARLRTRAALLAKRVGCALDEIVADVPGPAGSWVFAYHRERFLVIPTADALRHVRLQFRTYLEHVEPAATADASQGPPTPARSADAARSLHDSLAQMIESPDDVLHAHLLNIGAYPTTLLIGLADDGVAFVEADHLIVRLIETSS